MTRPPAEWELSDAALGDIRRLRDYIARRNPAAAIGLVHSILAQIRLVQENPGLGACVPGRGDGMRVATVPSFRTYRIFYQHDAGRRRIRIVRVLHAAREWADLLDG